jgi:hypothetical protein
VNFVHYSNTDVFWKIIFVRNGEISGSHDDEYEDNCLLVGPMLRRVVWYKLTDVSEVLCTSITRAP